MIGLDVDGTQKIAAHIADHYCFVAYQHHYLQLQLAAVLEVCSGAVAWQNSADNEPPAPSGRTNGFPDERGRSAGAPEGTMAARYH